MKSPLVIKHVLSFAPYWRSIKACEQSDYRSALSNYGVYRDWVGNERPSDRALHAKLLILNSEYDEAAAKLCELIQDLEIDHISNQNKLTAYVLAYAKIALAGLMGDAKREEYCRLAETQNPPPWLDKLLPIAR